MTRFLQFFSDCWSGLLGLLDGAFQGFIGFIQKSHFAAIFPAVAGVAVWSTGIQTFNKITFSLASVQTQAAAMVDGDAVSSPGAFIINVLETMNYCLPVEEAIVLSSAWLGFLSACLVTRLLMKLAAAATPGGV